MTTFIVMPLAADVRPDWKCVGENFKYRARRALFRAWELAVSDRHDVYLAQGAGAPATVSDTPTLAELGAEYLTACRPELPMLVNTSDRAVWGTLGEVLWVYEKAMERFSGDVVLVLVSQPRHLRRIKLIVRWFLPDTAEVQFVTSGQAFEISWVHEARAYLALALTKLGLGKIVSFIRRPVSLKVDSG